MHAFPAGTRVFFWVNGQLVYGVVQSTSWWPDGTQVFVILDENGQTLSLLAASVTKVT
ncbi:hypothetical protein BDN72DRAFT_834422 [Pluteus cervinus]|uniref:Uncharacterized protein n=1 Tax=Pluteus cervinus TaxID=181527 RepID=A0ACD3B656_9AGAR|nr:hypothetical protein BDN72DRAFT_834422 [Pluteus cervinus]